MPRIAQEVKLDFKDVLIRPRRRTIISRKKVDLHHSYGFRHSKKQYHGIPVVAANMHCIGTLEIAKSLASRNCFTALHCTALHKHYTAPEIKQLLKANPGIENNVVICSGGNASDYERLTCTLRELPDIQYICLDVANGYGDFLVNRVRQVREEFQSLTIAAGNIVTTEVLQELIESGVDIVKVGIGPGSVCTTRVKTGVGYPQLSALMECAETAHELGAHVIADGGCSVAGDIAKAFGAGSDFVMLGGMLAGHDESADELVTDYETGQMYKVFYGTSSKTASDKYWPNGGEYRAAEGKTVRVPCKGSVSDTISDILGDLRSACTYVGANRLSELSELTTFLRVTQQANEVYRGLEHTSPSPTPSPQLVTPNSSSSNLRNGKSLFRYPSEYAPACDPLEKQQ